MEDFMKDYTSAAPMCRPQQVWKKSDVVSMDDLMQFDQELENDFNIIPDNEKLIPSPSKITPVTTHSIPTPLNPHRSMTSMASKSRSKAKSFHSVQAQPRKILPQFDSGEALSMLMDIQNSEQPDKFSLIDGFLDKYKVNKRPRIDNTAYIIDYIR